MREAMARCATCRKTIRKAEVVWRIRARWFIERVSLHFECVQDDDVLVLPETLKLLALATPKVAEARAAQGEAEGRAWELAEQLGQARCRIALLDQTHPRGRCSEGGWKHCPVPEWCGHEFDINDPVAVKLHTTVEYVCRKTSAFECEHKICNHMWCDG